MTIVITWAAIWAVGKYVLAFLAGVAGTWIAVNYLAWRAFRGLW